MDQGRRAGSRFRRNFLRVGLANLAAQALPLALLPWLSRLYAPADFAVVAVFASLLSMLLAAGTGRFEWSVPNTRSRINAAALLMLGATVLLLPVAVLLVLAAAGQGLAWPTRPAARDAGGGAVLMNAAATATVSLPAGLVGLLALAALAGGINQLLQSWFVQAADLSAVGRAKIADSAANVGVQLAAGLVAPGPAGLVAGVIAGLGASLWMLARQAQGLAAALAAVTRRRLRRCRDVYGRESLLSTLVSLVNAASLAAMPLLLAQHYGAAEVGWYALMQRLAVAPTALITSAVAQSFWAEAARLVRSDRPALRRLYLRSTRRLAWLGAAAAPVLLAGPLYIGPLLGEAAWGPAGTMLAALTPLIVAQVIVSPLSHLVVHRKQRWQIVWDVARLGALCLVTLGGGGAGWPVARTVAAVAAVGAVFYGLLFGLNLRALRPR